MASLDVQVTVRTLGGEAAIPPGPMAADVTVGELLHYLRREDRPAELLQLVLGSRPLAAHEQLGELAGEGTEEGLVLTLMRQVVDATLLDAMRARVRTGTLRLRPADGEASAADVAAVACLLQDPAVDMFTLDLSGMRVADVAPIAEALRANTCLEVLDLSDTGVHDVRALAECVRANTVLRELRLARTKVEQWGALIGGVRENRSLRCLDLRGCAVDEGCKRELEAIEKQKGFFQAMCP